MTRVLAMLALVFAQTLPWVGGPLFFCIESDGTVCLDGGPQNCDCCAVEASDSQSCHDEHFAPNGAASCSRDRSAALHDAPCDCKHQLWEAAPTTPAGRTAVALTDHAAAAPFASAAVLTPIGSSQSMAADMLFGPSAGAAERLLARVVLRC